MKVKYLAVFYTFCMAVAASVMYVLFSGGPDTKKDMLYYNEQRKQVEQSLQQGRDRREVEQDYCCSILFLVDEDYEARLNELFQEGAVIFDCCEEGRIIGKTAWNEEKQSLEALRGSLLKKGLVIWALLLTGGYLLLFFIYLSFIRPFRRLQQFSVQIAGGNFDFPLPVQKHNFFGAFTESFDLMREELKRAKESEYRANQSKKELVAELSHDIKTPVSTIKAACEVMELKEKQESTLEKVRVIAAKADTIDRLIGNLFHATMEELEILKVEPAEESSLCIWEMFQELKYYGDILLVNTVPECLLWLDRLRLEQVIDNIVNNSYKYARTAVKVSFEEQKEGIGIQICDSGPGVLEEETALLTEKFYRGSNAKGKAGSGLGLYLSRLFMEQMGGSLECGNQSDESGFAVRLYIKKV